jgi:hypothetical protein
MISKACNATRESARPNVMHVAFGFEIVQSEAPYFVKRLALTNEEFARVVIVKRGQFIQFFS